MKQERDEAPTTIAVDAAELRADINDNTCNNRNDLVFGTYDEETNCITVTVDDQVMVTERIKVGEFVAGDKQLMSRDHATEGSIVDIPLDELIKAPPTPLSPLTLTDSGYDSTGSPHSNLLDDWNWNESLTELFPSLA